MRCTGPDTAYYGKGLFDDFLTAFREQSQFHQEKKAAWHLTTLDLLRKMVHLYQMSYVANLWGRRKQYCSKSKICHAQP